MDGRNDPQRPLQERLEALIAPICKNHGVDLYDVRMFRGGKGGATLRVILERPGTDAGGGVTLDDCQLVSRGISAALDEEDTLAPKGAYHLEVSSPGLDRPLFALAHFERFVGHEARVETRIRIGERRRFSGILRGVEDGSVLIEEAGQILNIPHESILKANLVYKL